MSLTPCPPYNEEDRAFAQAFREVGESDPGYRQFTLQCFGDFWYCKINGCFDSGKCGSAVDAIKKALAIEKVNRPAKLGGMDTGKTVSGMQIR